MKKITVLPLCAMIAFSFMSCQNHESNVVSSESIESTPQQMANPFVNCETMDEACKTAGFDFDVPDTIEGYTDRDIKAIKNNLIQITYRNTSDSILVRKGTGNEDISGDYNKYTEINTVSVNDLQVTAKGNGKEVNLAIWTDGDFAFSVMPSTAISADRIVAIVESVK